MRFLALEDCSDSELHCLYHDPERTVTLLHPRTACSLQVYATEDGNCTVVGTFNSCRPNNAHSWLLQRLDIAGYQLLGIAHDVVRNAFTVAQTLESAERKTALENIRHLLTKIRCIIPHADALDEEEHIQTIQPLPSPWSWPSNTYYREVRRGYTEYLTEPLIAELVTHGLLLANDVGIRWKHMDQYILVMTDEPVSNRENRPRFEKHDAPAFRRARIERPGLHGEPNGVEARSGTPIVELDGPSLDVGKKRVRLHCKKTCVAVDGEGAAVAEEDLEGNKEKTAVNKVSGVMRVRKERTRSKISWDSDRGF